jgi:hypothetical protein
MTRRSEKTTIEFVRLIPGPYFPFSVSHSDKPIENDDLPCQHRKKTKAVFSGPVQKSVRLKAGGPKRE